MWRNRIQCPRPHTGFGKNAPRSLTTTTETPRPAAEHLPALGGDMQPRLSPPRGFLAGRQQFPSPRLAKSSAPPKKKKSEDFSPASPRRQNSIKSPRAAAHPRVPRVAPPTWERFPKLESAGACALAIAGQRGGQSGNSFCMTQGLCCPFAIPSSTPHPFFSLEIRQKGGIFHFRTDGMGIFLTRSIYHHRASALCYANLLGKIKWMLQSSSGR